MVVIVKITKNDDCNTIMIIIIMMIILIIIVIINTLYQPGNFSPGSTTEWLYFIRSMD